MRDTTSPGEMFAGIRDYDVTFGHFSSIQLRSPFWYSLAVQGDATMPIVKCPTCGRDCEFTGNEFRPFCSERCKLLDFGAWADEEFAIPSETSSLSDEEIDALERASEGKQV